MAVHASLGAGHDRVSRLFYSRVAVATIHPKLIHVQGMIESHRLGRLIANAGVFGRKVISHAGNHAGRDDRHTDQDLDRQPVGPTGKNIGHEGGEERKSVGIRGLGLSGVLKLRVSRKLFKKALEVLTDNIKLLGSLKLMFFPRREGFPMEAGGGICAPDWDGG